MKSYYLFVYLLLGSLSLSAQFRLDVEGDAKINGRLALDSGASNLFIGNGTGSEITSGDNNIFIGSSAGNSNTEGRNNTFLGVVAGFFNTSGQRNTIIGAGAGLFNNTGSSNAFFGDDAGSSNTASNNTFIGSQAGWSNTSGTSNTFVGRAAGRLNRNNSGLVAVGDSSLYNNGVGATSSEGTRNTAVGSKAGFSNTSGFSNTFLGNFAGYANTSGFQNTFLGVNAGISNTTGGQNTFLGRFAGYFNTIGYSNTFLGINAGLSNTTGFDNTFVGKLAGNGNTTGSGLIALGAYAAASLLDNTPVNNAFVIGNHGLATGSHSGTLGNISMQKLTGYVNFGTASDGRMKKQIREDVQGLDFILALRPVSYQVDALKLDQFLQQGMEDVRSGKEKLTAAEKAKARESRQTYESHLRAKSAIRYTGFIAQEVEKAMTESGFDFSGLVKPAHDKDHYSLRYAEFVVPLVKGMQEQQELIDEQKQEVQQLQSTVQEQQEQIDELKSLVQLLLAQQPNQTPVPTTEREPKPQARLSQNSPNPFHENTVINYFLPEGVDNARLEVHSVDGKLLTTLPLPQKGEGQVQLKADSFPAGTYLYSLIIGSEVLATKRMVLTK